MRWEWGRSTRGRRSRRSRIDSRHRKSIILPVREVQIGPENNPAAYAKGGENFFLRIKRPGRKAFQAPPSTAQFGNVSTTELYCCFPWPPPWRAPEQLHLCLGPRSTSFRFRLWQIPVFLPMTTLPSPYKIYSRGIISPGVQRPMRVADHSTPFTAEVTNAWRFISTNALHLLGRSKVAVSPDTCRWGYIPLK